VSQLVHARGVSDLSHGADTFSNHSLLPSNLLSILRLTEGWRPTSFALIVSFSCARPTGRTTQVDTAEFFGLSSLFNAGTLHPESQSPVVVSDSWYGQ